MSDSHTPKSPNIQIVSAAITHIEGEKWLTCKLKNVGNEKATSIAISQPTQDERPAKFVSYEEIKPGEEIDHPVLTIESVLGWDLVGVGYDDHDYREKPKVVGAGLTNKIPDKLAGQAVNGALGHGGFCINRWLMPSIKKFDVEYQYNAQEATECHVKAPIYAFIVQKTKPYRRTNKPFSPAH